MLPPRGPSLLLVLLTRSSEMQLARWDSTTKVTYDRIVWNDLVTLRFLDEHAHVAIVGPVGTGKTFLAHALGHIATRRAHSVLAVSADHMLKGERAGFGRFSGP